MIFGDFRYFLIVDRIGMQIEIIPHLFGATNQRPIGSRGLLAYWRNTSRVLSSAAFKVLVTT
jgi:HK97 family phage major capsid protein